MLRLKAGHNLGFVRDSFLLLRAQLSIWNTTCTTSTTMAPTDRRHKKKPKDISPWLRDALVQIKELNSTKKLGLSLSPLPLLICTPLTFSSTDPQLLLAFCVMYCILYDYRLFKSAPSHCWPSVLCATVLSRFQSMCFDAVPRITDNKLIEK